MAALNNVIYGDGRYVSDTLSSFLNSDKEENSTENEAKEACPETLICGYDPSIFIDEEEANKYICPICQHVLRDAIDIGCGNRHTFCNDCFQTYYNLNYEDYDNNYVYYGIGNEDWSVSSNPELWNPNKCKPHTLVHCPLCKSKVKHNDNRQFQRMLVIDEKIANELLIRCSNHDLCEWNGRLTELASHKVVECEYEEIPCDLCPHKAARKDMVLHVSKQHPVQYMYSHSIL